MRTRSSTHSHIHPPTQYPPTQAHTQTHAQGRATCTHTCCSDPDATLVRFFPNTVNLKPDAGGGSAPAAGAPPLLVAAAAAWSLPVFIMYVLRRYKEGPSINQINQSINQGYPSTRSMYGVLLKPSGPSTHSIYRCLQASLIILISLSSTSKSVLPT